MPDRLPPLREGHPRTIRDRTPAEPPRPPSPPRLDKTGYSRRGEGRGRDEQNKRTGPDGHRPRIEDVLE